MRHGLFRRAAAPQHQPRRLSGGASRGRGDGEEISARLRDRAARHTRDQLLYAVSGVMRIQTDAEAWIVPPDRAVYLPAGTRHTVGIRGNLEMRTLYITEGQPRAWRHARR